jgi:hypothetical protein
MRQINNWDDADARKQATRAFCAYLHRPENAQAREKCKGDPAFARNLFAQQGGFCLEEELTPDEANPIAPIPKQTEFRVFESTDMFPRDRLVTLVLPPADKVLPETAKIDTGEIYRCTWVLW